MDTILAYQENQLRFVVTRDGVKQFQKGLAFFNVGGSDLDPFVQVLQHDAVFCALDKMRLDSATTPAGDNRYLGFFRWTFFFLPAERSAGQLAPSARPVPFPTRSRAAVAEPPVAQPACPTRPVFFCARINWVFSCLIFPRLSTSSFCCADTWESSCCCSSANCFSSSASDACC